MAKLTSYPDADALSGDELVPIVQGGALKKIAASDLVAGSASVLVWSGNGAPDVGLGTNGDFYIDKADWLIFGPKAGGAWPAGVSLIGEGPQGDPGQSAYELAVSLGFAGDDAAWLASLVGPQGEKGDKGDQGDPGDAAPETIAVAAIAGDVSAVAANAADISTVAALGEDISTVAGAVTDALDGKADVDSPTLTGTPLAPTAAAGTNTTQIATTAFVKAAIDALIAGAPGAMDTLKELADALEDDASYAATVTALLAAKASLTGAETLTNKRVTERVVAAGVTTGNLQPNADTTDVFKALGLTGACTVLAPSGTPTDGQVMVLRLRDNGAVRALAWNAIWRAIGVTLPDATTAGKLLVVVGQYDGDDAAWDVLSVRLQG